MQVHFLGTGEAFDDHLPNTSVLLQSPAMRILVDCGFTVPPRFWQAMPLAHSLDALYLTHLHGDHCFGLPALLVRMHEQGRKNALDVLATPERLDAIRNLLDTAYAGFAAKLRFELRLAPIPLPGVGNWKDVRVWTAPTVHGSPNFAVRFDFPGGESVMVSGDGEVTPESAELMAGCDLVVHEAYRMADHTPGHSSVREVLEAVRATEPPPGQVALVHTNRKEREHLSEMWGDFLVPTPGTIYALTPGRRRRMR
jgi:ribonuclease Z